MPIIQIHMEIEAPMERCFDLSRSIDLHQISTQQTNEKAIDGVTSGLIELNEWVTWQARHFGISQKLTSKITEYERPLYFVDEMVKGAFKRFRHEHHFEVKKGRTVMTDIFDYDSPFGPLGKLVDFLILKRYMTQLLTKRNGVIKQFAESDRWTEVLE